MVGVKMAHPSGITVPKGIASNSEETIWVKTGVQKLEQFVRKDQFGNGISAMCIRPMPNYINPSQQRNHHHYRYCLPIYSLY